MAGDVSEEVQVVYRLEKVGTERGPYTAPFRSPTLCELITKRCMETPSHPGPVNDIKGWSFNQAWSGWVFGFISIKDLETWFDPEVLEQAYQEGFIITIYSVPKSDVLYGSKQVAFRR